MDDRSVLVVEDNPVLAEAMTFALTTFGWKVVGPFRNAADAIARYKRLAREDVYICNVVKCRPPGNRTPLADEVSTCSPFAVHHLIEE